MPLTNQPDYEKKGWLLKWTNLAKGYKKRWFVLSEGCLSYYRNQPEEAYLLRGSISLLETVVQPLKDKCSFIVSKNETNVFYLKATDSKERQEWISILEQAKNCVISERDSVNMAVVYNVHQKNAILHVISIGQNLEELQEQIGDLSEHSNRLKTAISININAENTISSINDYKVNSNSVLNTFSKHCNLSTINCHGLQKILEQENNLRESLEHLVTESQLLVSHIDKVLASSEKPNFSSLETFCNNIKQKLQFKDTNIRRPYRSNVNGKIQVKRVSLLTTDDCEDSIIFEDNTPQLPYDLLEKNDHRPSSLSVSVKTGMPRIIKRRTLIPEKPNCSINLWSVLKNSIGKDITKLPIPVHFCEPLSFLQRIAEDFVYSAVLDEAASCTDEVEELAYLAVFTISTYASTAYRNRKPFNPLLGETYELDRRDLGWKLISEQVSHHPPIAAQFCEGNQWTCWQEFAMASKFRGKYLQITPLGTSHIEFKSSGNRYSWKKATTIIYNIIIGKLWVDQEGDVDIVNVDKPSKCHLTYIPYSLFKSDEQRKVIGEVKDSTGEVKWLIKGQWDKEVALTQVLSTSGRKDRPNYKTGISKVIWKATPIPLNREKFYFFDEFACQLNEMEEGVAPTDSRYRPDQRFMENGLYDEANIVKQTLEERQRARRKAMAKRGSVDSNASVLPNTGIDYQPLWFERQIDSYTGRLFYIYKGGYWECKEMEDWKQCPDLFSYE